MYQENGGFDQSSSLHGGGAEDAFSQTNLPNNNFEQSYPQNDVAAASDLEMELQHHLNIDNCSDIQDTVSNWHDFNHHLNSAADFTQNIYDGHYPDLLNMFPLLPNSSITFSQKSPAFLASLGLLGEVNGSGDASYDPLLPLNQPPLLRELFHSLPHGGGGVYSLGARNGSLFGMDEREGNVVFEFGAADIGKSRDGSKDTKNFATERHRRVLLNGKYQTLRELIPSPTKNDRASIVGDAILYINELKRTVTELKGWVEKKRYTKEMLKRPKIEENESKCISSWLHRKSNNTEVDVRIIEDQVTVKLVQQKRINCLLFVSEVLDELQLHLHHVAGGLIGDYYSFLFNSKICEGSIVYASAVANKLIEVVDKQYAAVPPSSY